MPIYEYECTRCSFRLELKQGFGETSSLACPRCGGDTRRIFSPVAIIFKGPGFYCTDNRRDGDQPSDEPGMNVTTGDAEVQKEVVDKAAKNDG